VSLLPVAIANGWAAGINAYAVVLVLGLLGRSGAFDAPDVLQRTDVLVAAGVLTVADFVADKVPYVDSAWDAVHTAVRPTIAAVLGALLAGDATSLDQALTAVGMGGTALWSHLTKAALRLAVNTSPEPASNVGVSLFEDVTLVGVVTLATEHPWWAAGIALTLLLVGGALVIYLAHRIRRALRRRGEWWRGRRWSVAPEP
jgi:Domain of unknown function (DUF4126)